MNSTAPSPIGLAAAREGVAALRARIWLPILLAVAGIVIGFLLGGKIPNIYRVWLSAQPLGANRAVTELGISTPEGPQAADFLDGAVLRRLEVTTRKPYDFLVEHLVLTQPPTGAPNPPVLLLAKVDDTAESKALIRAWVAAIRDVRTARVQHTLAHGELGLRKDLATARRKGEDATAAELTGLLARMHTLRATLSSDFAIYKKPLEIESKSTSRSHSAEVGAIVGLIAGLCLALAIALLDGRLRTRDGIEAASGLELLADLDSRQGVPSAEHARARLRALGGGSMPSPIVCVPCGSIDAGAAEARVSEALGDQGTVQPAGQLGEAEALERLAGAGAVVVAATPGGVRRAELADLRAELGGIVDAPVGLVVV